MSVQLQIPTGKNNYPLYEFPGDDIPANKVLYNSEGVEINYGYDSQGRYRVAYGALDSSSADSAFAFGGKKYTSGLHSINLSRPLANGEQITIMWYDGHELIIYGENGYLEVKPSSGSNPHNLGLYELVHIDTGVTEDIPNNYFKYVLTEDTSVVNDKKYYNKTLITKVKKRNGGSYSEIGKKVNNGENTALYFNDDMNTKRFDKIETNSFEEF